MKFKNRKTTIFDGTSIKIQTNGEAQSNYLVEYMMDGEMKGSFYRLKIVSDFAGIQRFVTGFRTPNSR